MGDICRAEWLNLRASIWNRTVFIWNSCENVADRRLSRLLVIALNKQSCLIPKVEENSQRRSSRWLWKHRRDEVDQIRSHPWISVRQRHNDVATLRKDV